MRSRRRFLAFTSLALLGATALVASRRVPRATAPPRAHGAATAPKATATLPMEPQIRRVEVKSAAVRKIVDAARAQVGDDYDASYRVISYPNGDVPKGLGACTDVIVRAFRGAGIDLQQRIHDDMKAHFAAYPNSWKLGRTDKNIDHRRVPNHIVFFKRFGEELPIGTTGNDLKTWQPGDVVEWKLDNGLWHTGLISDGVGPRGLPLVVHNGWECVEQDALDAWQIKAHFRFPRR